jgi:hypothetical protein
MLVLASSTQFSVHWERGLVIGSPDNEY